jgi:outer membrane protein OmpA-like peptidoglycan-associated protein
VSKLDESQLTDRDQRAFQQSKSVIESAFIYFLSNQDKFATEAFAPLSRLPEEIRTLITAGRQLGMNSHIEVRGSADGTGASEKNRDLSERRAVAVRDFLVSCGLESDRLQPLGLGQVGEAPPGEKAAAQESDRRVAFRVVTEPISTRP